MKDSCSLYKTWYIKSNIKFQSITIKNGKRTILSSNEKNPSNIHGNLKQFYLWESYKNRYKYFGYQFRKKLFVTHYFCAQYSKMYR